MDTSQFKTIRLKLKTGEMFLRRDVEEFLIGKRYFILVTNSKGTETYPTDNILSVEYFTHGEFVKVPYAKSGKAK